MNNCCKLVGYTIRTSDNDKNPIKLCPNHMAEALYDHTLNLTKGEYISEISGKEGAVLVAAPFETDIFKVTTDEAIRLLGHALMPDEFVKLQENHKDSFEIHDDFYSNDGYACQPVDEDTYLAELREYAKRQPEKVQKNIKDYIEFVFELLEED